MEGLQRGSRSCWYMDNDNEDRMLPRHKKTKGFHITRSPRNLNPLTNLQLHYQVHGSNAKWIRSGHITLGVDAHQNFDDLEVKAWLSSLHVKSNKVVRKRKKCLRRTWN